MAKRANRVFQKRSLCKEGACLPPSLPLILPGNCSYNTDTHQVTSSRCTREDGITPKPQFHLVEETLALIESISKPVAVLSICGPYRSGKSYFLSRLLRNEGTFQLGHTMKACTRGIWLATSVLECEEIAVLVLDTEGTDSVNLCSTEEVTKLLAFVLHVSSMLVYNSRNVPRGKDLKKLSFLAGLSKMVECEDACTSDPHNLPDLLWLLRDVDRLLVDENGTPITATEYVCSQLKKPSISQAGSTLLHHFPSLHCLTLPPPSSDRNVLSNIVTSRDKLTPAFNDDLQFAIQYILNNVRGKQGYNSSVQFNGNLLACLIRQCYNIFGGSHSNLPSLRMSWSVVVETTLKKKAIVLVNEYEYESDMRRQLNGKLPINDGVRGEMGQTLMNIHLQVFAKKRLALQKDIVCYQPHLPSESLSALELDVISAFDDSVAEYDTSVQLSQVVGGRLFFFLKENMMASEVFCSALYRDKYDGIVHAKLQSILSSQIPGSINEELSRFVKEYNSEAKGPAISKVFKSLRKESSRLEAELELIPGPVEKLEVVGVDADRVKLRWEKPDINPLAAKYYSILIKSKSRSWQEVSSRNGYSALVTGLKCSTWYCFAVKARSDRYCGKKILFIRVRTLMSQSLQKLVGASTILASPVVYPSMVAYIGYGYISRGIESKSLLDVVGGAFVLAMLPAVVIVGLTPIAGPLACNDSYKNEIANRKGDLEESDTHVMKWKGGDGYSPDDLTSDRTVSSHDNLVDVPSDDEEIRNGKPLRDLEDSADENDQG